MNDSATLAIATITLNPAIDQTITVPDFAANQVNRVTASRADPGGKGVNVASILADLGLPVVATGFLGRENTQLFDALFARKQIEDCFIRIDGATRTGIKVVDPHAATTTDINFPGQAPTEADVGALLETVEALAARCGWFVMAGSLPAGAPVTLYRELVGRVRGAGRAIALDTSGPALAAALEAGPTLIKPNIHEMEALLGTTLPDRTSIVAAAQCWRAQYGIEAVVVSQGEEGALYVADEAVLHAQPPHVTVKSTVGAGDAMVSGLVAGLLEGQDPATCLRRATALAAAAITFVGSGLPPTTEVADLERQVIIAPVPG